MTKTDFAELKEKLCTELEVEFIIPPSSPFIPMEDAKEMVTSAVSCQHKHHIQVISELIEIISLQSEALEFYADPFTYTENEYAEKKIDYYRTYEKGEYSLSETTTRLQKLREGK